MVAISEECGISDCWIKGISDYLSSNIASLKLVITLLIGYPLALIYAYHIKKYHSNVHHLYYFFTGFALFYWNFGVSTCHSVINAMVIYLLIQIAGGTALSVVVALIFNNAYLIIGYQFTADGSYDISWTLPHCILTLRLSGLIWDLYDGQQKKKDLSPSQQISAMSHKPNLLQLLGYTYFHCAFLVGPQFPMTRYLDSVNNNMRKTDEELAAKNRSLICSVRRIAMGLMYLAIYQVSSTYFNENRMLTSWFLREITWWQRVLYMTVFGKVVLYKYISVWLMAEGACAISGIGYNGLDGNSKELHDACANVRIRLYERSCCTRECVASFNVNTNKWMMEYVFKRLRFLGNKVLSQLITLVYLALWHGLFCGYYVNFFIEFLALYTEREFTAIVDRSWLRPILDKKVMRPLVYLIKKLHIQFLIGQALSAFALLTWQKVFTVYSAVYFIGFIHLLWPLAKPVLKALLVTQKNRAGPEGRSSHITIASDTRVHVGTASKSD